MTRQDFELIARVIREWQPPSPVPQWVATEMREALARDMAATLVYTHPRFDRDRFIAAATRTN